MRSTDPTLSTSVRTSGDPAHDSSPVLSSAVSSSAVSSSAAEARPSGRPTGRRRAAVAGETAPRPVVAGAPITAQPAVLTVDAPARVTPSIDPAVSPRRAARAAREAAAALSAGQAPVSPALPGLPSQAAPSSPVVATVSTPAEPGATALEPASRVEFDLGVEAAPSQTAGGVARPARASHPSALVSTGRRETFLPSTAGEAHVRTLQRTATAAERRRAALSTRALPVRPQPTGALSSSTSVRGRRAPGRVGAAVRRVAIVTVVAGILATTVLPVLEHTQGAAYAAGNTGAQPVARGSQQLDVASDSADIVTGRDSYGATSVVDYEKQVIANREAASSSTYTGPSAEYYQAHPLYSHTPLDRSQVFDVALQYLGTPYVHGGADPSAFDCSGFIMFVYAQFGITLAHYVPTQNLEGTTIPQSEAVPGDLVIFDNGAHDGFYAGNGMILDAPKPGGVVSVRPIWNQAHHFVRIGS